MIRANKWILFNSKPSNHNQLIDRKWVKLNINTRTVDVDVYNDLPRKTFDDLITEALSTKSSLNNDPQFIQQTHEQVNVLLTAPQFKLAESHPYIHIAIWNNLSQLKDA